MEKGGSFVDQETRTTSWTPKRIRSAFTVIIRSDSDIQYNARSRNCMLQITHFSRVFVHLVGVKVAPTIRIHGGTTMQEKTPTAIPTTLLMAQRGERRDQRTFTSSTSWKYSKLPMLREAPSTFKLNFAKQCFKAPLSNGWSGAYILSKGGLVKDHTF